MRIDQDRQQQILKIDRRSPGEAIFQTNLADEEEMADRVNRPRTPGAGGYRAWRARRRQEEARSHSAGG